MERARQIVTVSAPRPKARAANQIRPPTMGMASIRRMPHPSRKATTQGVPVRRIRRPMIQAVALYPSV